MIEAFVLICDSFNYVLGLFLKYTEFIFRRKSCNALAIRGNGHSIMATEIPDIVYPSN